MEKRRSSLEEQKHKSKKSKTTETEFTIKKLKDKRTSKGKVEYRVEWDGYPDSDDDTWEPKEGLPKESIKEYEDEVLERWRLGYTVTASGINIENDVRINMETGSSYMIGGRILSKSKRFIEEDQEISHIDNYYQCKLRNKEYRCILKFPSAFVDTDYYGVDHDNGEIGIVGQNGKEKKDKKEYVLSLPGEPLQRYKEESAIASELLDSIEHIKHRDPYTIEQIKPDSVNNSVLTVIEHEMKTMREHPGYSRIYPIRYVDAMECFAIGKQCDGFVASLINSEKMPFKLKPKEGDTFGEIPHIWLSLAYQIGQAILFMRNIRKMSHVNINQDNILYEEHKHGFSFYLYGFLDCYKSSEDLGDIGLYNFALFLVDILTKHTDIQFRYRQKKSTSRITQKQTDCSKVSNGDRILIVNNDGEIENAFILARGKKNLFKIILDKNREEVIEQDLSEKSFKWNLTSSLDFHWYSEDTGIEKPQLQYMLKLLENILNSSSGKRYTEFCKFLSEVEKYLIPEDAEVGFKKIERLFN